MLGSVLPSGKLIYQNALGVPALGAFLFIRCLINSYLDIEFHLFVNKRNS